VKSLVYDYRAHPAPGWSRWLRILARSEAFATPPAVVRRDWDLQLKTQFRALFLRVQGTTGGWAVLAPRGIERVVALSGL